MSNKSGNIEDLPVDSGVSGLTTDQLISLTLRDAWMSCGEDRVLLKAMIDVVSVNCARYRGITLPDSIEVREQIAAGIMPLLEIEGDQLFAFAVDKAVAAAVDYAGYAAERKPMNATMGRDSNQVIPAESGVSGLTTEQLVALTVQQARALCGNDDSAFLVMINTVALNCAKYRGIDLPASDLARLRLGEAIAPLLAGEGDQRFASSVDAALMAALNHAPISAETIAAYNAVRTCNNKRTVCHAPTTSMYFGRDGFVTACCYSRSNPLGSWPAQSVAEIWFGERIKEMQRQLRRNVLPMGCETCAGQLEAHNFKGLLAGNFDAHVPAPSDGVFSKLGSMFRKAEPVIYPVRMEFELSNKCNLECAMCSGLFSSTIRSNRENKPPLPQVYDSEFVRQLRQFIPHLKQAKFLGGEPFLIDIYYEIWELFIELNPACEIVITTNGTVFTNKVQRVLEQLNCQIIVSLDSIEKATYESIRVNGTMERTLEHVEKFMTLNKQRSKPLSIAVCPIQKNWREIPGIVKFANSKGMALFFNTVTYPDTESLKHLPNEQKARVLEVFRSAQGTGKNAIEAGNFRAVQDLCLQVEMWMAEAKPGEPVLLNVI